MVDVRRRSGTRGLPWYTHKPRLRGCPRGSRGRRWRSYLSGPRREEPRSAAERLLALETKFLLFWVGQERDSVLSSKPVRRQLWPSPTADTSAPRRTERPLWHTAWSVGPMEKVKRRLA